MASEVIVGMASVTGAAAVGWVGWLTRPNVARRRAEGLARLYRNSGGDLASHTPRSTQYQSAQYQSSQHRSTQYQSAQHQSSQHRSTQYQSVQHQSSRVAYQTAVELGSIIDIVMVGVSSGLSILAALQLAARDGPRRLGGHLGTLLDDDQLPLADALDEFGRSCGPRAGSFVEVLASSIRYGIELQPALERIQRELREEIRRRIDKRIRQLPVLMLFPLVFCVLPALGLIGVVPVLVAAFQF